MFRKSLVLLSMVFGLNAWGAPPDDITAAQLILMVEGNGQIQGTEGEIWVLDRNSYSSGPLDKNQQEFLLFLQGLPPQKNASPMFHGHGMPPAEISYQMMGVGILTPPHKFKLHKQQQ